MERRIVGWREWVGLPELGIERIKAKVDTGARTSSLHAVRIEPFLRDGRSWVRFDVHPVQRDSRTTVTCEAPVVDERVIRNPGGGGREEHRFVILTTLHLFGTERPIEVTLARRDAMGFRMLLGRQALRHRFLVDPGASYRSDDPAPPPGGRATRRPRTRPVPEERPR